MTLEIIVHLWARSHPHYAALARYQLSSLVLCPTDCAVIYSVCYDPEDRLTVELLDEFAPRLATEAVSLRRHPMESRRLFRRAIARNDLALASAADAVYFAGCDYVWGPGALDAIQQAAVAYPQRLVYPWTILRNRTHALGDAAATRAASAIGLAEIDPADFQPARLPCAIGCTQIVAGDVARQLGYLAGQPRWRRPIDAWNFHDDVAFRRDLASHGIEPLAVFVPNLYRLRHSTCGYQ